MRLQAPAAEIANGPVIVSWARNIDFARNAFAEPALPRCRGNAGHLDDFANEFMARYAAKLMIAAENFHVGITNPRQTHANEGPARPQLRNWTPDLAQFSVSRKEGQQLLFLGFFGKHPV
jgi:hypothetical protein